MKTIHTQAELKTTVLNMGELDSSFALAVFRNELDAHALVAIRQADRVCDFTIVLATTPLDDAQKGLLAQAGADVLFQPEAQELPVYVETGVKDVDSTVHLQTILNIMPLVVAIPPSDFKLHEALERLNQAFPDTFSLLAEETPLHLLNGSQQKAREALLVGKDMLLAGEGNFSVLKNAMLASSAKYGFTLKSFSVLDENLNPCETGKLPSTGIISAHFERYGEPVADTIRF